MREGRRLHWRRSSSSSSSSSPLLPLLVTALPDLGRWDDGYIGEDASWDGGQTRDVSNRTCETAACLQQRVCRAELFLKQHTCDDGEYNPLASLLLQPGEEVHVVGNSPDEPAPSVVLIRPSVRPSQTWQVVRALFSRGTPHALPPSDIAACLAVWLVLTALTAGVTLPLGLLVPLLISGGCAGRLYGMLLRSLFLSMGSAAEGLDPGLFALLGATALMAGSGQIRLFLTMIMLEARACTCVHVHA